VVSILKRTVRSKRVVGSWISLRVLLLTFGLVLLAACATPRPNPSLKEKGAKLSAQNLKEFKGQRGRLITIESWLSTLGYALVWTVTNREIIVYTDDDFGRPQIERARIPISAELVERIRHEIDGIPKDLYGTEFSREGLSDGHLFRFSFTSNGSYRKDRIEFDNGVTDESLFRLVDWINSELPYKLSIRFKSSESHTQYAVERRPISR